MIIFGGFNKFKKSMYLSFPVSKANHHF